MTPRIDPSWTDDDLERELAALGREIDFPPTPDLVTPVRAALVAPRRRWDSASLLRRPIRRGFVLAVVGLIAAAGIVAGAFYGIGGLRIAFVDRLPSVPPPTIGSGPLGSTLALGDLTDLAKAGDRAPFEILLPRASAYATADAVYFGSGLAGGQVSLVFGPATGRPAAGESGVSVLVTEFSGALEGRLAQKSVGPGTTVEVLTVNGGVGFWIEGEPHVIVYRDPTGNYVHESMRLVRNSLAWEQAGTVIRIEGDLSREEALALAGTFVPAR
jgi:hypothetical protein